MTNEAFGEWMKKRTKKLAVDIIKFLDTLRSTPSLTTIRFQLIKSTTSSAANYRAVCRGRSDKEFYAKLSIVVEETDETLFWLEMLQDLQYGNQTTLSQLLKEAEEILSIVASSRKTTGQKLKK